MISYLVISLLIISGFVYYLVYIRPKFNPLNKAEQFLKTNQLHDAIIEYKKVECSELINQSLYSWRTA